MIVKNSKNMFKITHGRNIYIGISNVCICSSNISGMVEVGKKVIDIQEA